MEGGADAESQHLTLCYAFTGMERVQLHVQETERRPFLPNIHSFIRCDLHVSKEGSEVAYSKQPQIRENTMIQHRAWGKVKTQAEAA